MSQDSGGQGENPSTRPGFFRRFFVAAFFMAILLGTLLLLSEGGLRWYYRDVLSTADSLSYFSQASMPRFLAERNAFKLRGPLFYQAADKRYRIVVRGDSFTYGQGVFPASQRFTEKIANLFQRQAPGLPVEVINAGVCGFNLNHHIRHASFVSDIQPDFVLYQWYINDMDTSGFTEAKFQTMPRPLIANKKIHNFLFRHSALYYLLQNRYGILRNLLGKQRSYDDYLVEQFGDRQGKPAQRARAELERFIHYFKDQKIPMGIVLFPSFSRDMSEYRLGFLHDSVLDVCRKENIDCLDLRATYAGVRHRDLWANDFDPHPGVLAHDMAAQAIFAHYFPMWRRGALQKESRFSDESTQQDSQHE
ncbi:MAG: hypothetical protein LBU39_03880 [Desulfobulbaceae bacterium]|nr:hypothetical protein [Desulfobulbaceae bacterium]